MRKSIIYGWVIFGYAGLFAQGFDGNIEFRYATQKDTTNNVYWVKGNKVKLDQFAKTGTGIEGSFLFDLGAGEIKFLNPKRKLWGKQKSETPAVIRGTCVVTKGTGMKKVAGQNCKDYIVKNTDENTAITYWIAEGAKFNFFLPLIKLWNRKDKQSVYFSQIKNLPEGSMPLMSEERTATDNKVLTRLEVTKVTSTPPDNSTFDIPPGYSKFDQ
jgi:hypothetical protein